MADKKKIILAALAVMSVFVWLRGLGVFSKNRQKEGPPGAAVPLFNAQSGRARRAGHKDYKRNPFTAAPVSQSQSAGLQLGGVISDAQESYALINDQIVRTGDSIGVNKVVDIKENRVILSDGTKDIELKLEE